MMVRFIFSGLTLVMMVILQGCTETGTNAQVKRAEPQRALLPSQVLPEVPSFDVSSTDIQAGQQMGLDQAHESATGKSISPELSWSGAPQATKSYAVTCFDPDAPTGSGFWHWVVLNIPANVHSLAANSGREGDDALPTPAFQLRNDFGLKAFGGAAPPVGDPAHRYVFTVHALDIDSLELPADSSPAMAGFMITQHTLARAVIIPTYQRNP